MQSLRAQSQWTHLQNTTTAEVKATLGRMGWEDCESQRSEALPWDGVSWKCRSYPHKVSAMGQLKCQQSKDDTSGHAKVDGEKSVRLQLYAKSSSNWVSLGVEKWSSPEKATSVGCSVPHGQLWEIHYVYLEDYVYRHICMCRCMHSSITRKREAEDLKESRRSLWKTVNGKKGKEKCNSITISKISRENKSVFHLKSRNS